MKRFDLDWKLVMAFADLTIKHCLNLDFDSHGRQLLLINCFYIATSLSFDNLAASALKHLLIGKPGGEYQGVSFLKDILDQVQAMKLEEREGLVLDFCISICSSVLLFIENIARDTPFDRKSKVVLLSIEKIIVDVRNTIFILLDALFGYVVQYH